MSTARARVLTLAFLLTVITYLDRVCIAAAAPVIMEDLHLSVVQMSLVFSAFTLAYSVFEVPSGWLGDVRGPGRVLTRIVMWWSGFTMLTGAVRGFPSLIAVRFLFGAGEAGAFPNLMRSLAKWFPRRERGRATGVMFLGSRVGGMLSVPLALLLIDRVGWRVSFVSFGAVGLVWAVAWVAWYRDEPADTPAVSSDELAWIRQDRENEEPRVVRTPWRALATSRSVWAICAMYFTYGYGLYFYLTWLPTFLVRELGLTTLSGGVFAALPYLLAGLANVAGGWVTDRLARASGLRVARCWLGCTAFATSSALVIGSTLVAPPEAKALLLALALGAVDFALSACWSAPLDIAPAHAGVVTGLMNTFGNLGGFVCPILVGLVVARLNSWTVPFDIAAALYAAGALAWLAIDPERQVAVEATAT